MNGYECSIQNDTISKLLRVIELDEILHCQFHLSHFLSAFHSLSLLGVGGRMGGCVCHIYIGSHNTDIFIIKRIGMALHDALSVRIT